jgi:outer membrane biosynthesis protein TonB
LLITRFMPPPKFVPNEAKDAKVTLSLLPAPAPPPPKPIFVPTHPQQNVPHTQQQIESANDVLLQSKSKAARDANSLMPDVEGKPHASDMRNSPLVKAPQTPQVATSQPTPRQAQPQKPTPPTPNPQMAPKPVPRPLPPQPKPAPATPPQKTEPKVDPDTGLPVLPPLDAQTMSTPDQARPLAPAPSQEQVAGSIHGALGRSGDNSPAAMATELGKYKQYVYSVVGSYWYPDIDKHFGLIGVGVVHIQFTIHSDGTLSDITILEGENLDQLKSISKNALVAPAPFKPFSPAMIKEVGDSYTDDFSFSVY